MPIKTLNPSMDGVAGCENPDAPYSWAKTHDHAGDFSVDGGDSLYVQIRSSTQGGNIWYQFYRTLCLFDLSALGILGSIQIDSATLSFYGQSKTDTESWGIRLNVFESSPASSTAIVDGDYDSLDTTPLCDTAIDYADFSTSGYNDFILNSTAITLLQAAADGDGIAKLGLRESRFEAANSPPSPYVANRIANFYVYSNDWGTVAQRPELVVTYTAKFPTSAVVRVTGIRRIYRAGVYRMLLSLGEVSDMEDIAGVRDYERFRHWWSFEPEEPPPGKHDYPYPGDDPEKQFPWPTGASKARQEPEDRPDIPIPRTGRGAVPYAGDDPERQPFWKPTKTVRKLPFPAPPPSFEPKVILEAPKIFIRSIVNFVRSFWSDW